MEEDLDLIRLATQMPLSELGDKLLHLQPGSKLGLYLLELSNLKVDAFQVESAEYDLTQPLYWILKHLHSDDALSLSDVRQHFTHPDDDIWNFAPPDDPDRLYDGLCTFLALAMDAGFVSLAGERIMLSLLGNRQLLHPQPVLPLVAHFFHSYADESFFVRLIVGDLAQVFAASEWAPSLDPWETATALLAEMGQSATREEVAATLEVFNNFIYTAGCPLPTDATAMVLLQYLVSEALQPN